MSRLVVSNGVDVLDREQLVHRLSNGTDSMGPRGAELALLR
jgi:hypothetical protein